MLIPSQGGAFNYIASNIYVVTYPINFNQIPKPFITTHTWNSGNNAYSTIITGYQSSNNVNSVDQLRQLHIRRVNFNNEISFIGCVWISIGT